eukprot:TRINITY_DN91204_c0_g1_i1.p1 TRINITY_DN91204_c0_g1~~TRINITY_DN91204_c0_g1_i1.p1  ORF type:complete len:765 (+),score=197.01 TRINITY_DN91204_c0_g1_i1:34-2328(+)
MGGKRKRGGKGKGKGKGKAKGTEDDEEEEDIDVEAGEGKGRQAKRNRSGGEDAWRDCEPWELENASFEAYYRRQRICSEEDFKQLLETLRTGLPAAIRVNRLRLGASSLCERLRELVSACSGDSERECYAPQLLSWYAHGLGWMWPGLERRIIKKDRRHASLKEYLAQRERAGLISRQEVVSMLPPLFLGVEPHHLVLDLCAAPGSKTSQMLEVMHWSQAEQSGNHPKGMVLANELQWRRANMLAHQVARLGSPCMVVVNCDAMFFPDMYCGPAGEGGAREQFRFDRVLCDVPCSGDGTMRKTPYIWKSWTWKGALNLHVRQLSILNRGLELLKVGGRLVYSTCSLNPIEDEAVVAAALRRHGDSIVLVPPPSDLGEAVKAGRGLAKWVVPHPEKDGEFFEAFDDVPAETKQGKNKLLASMFPPYGDFATTWEGVRENCRRLLPHLMDTGGFFIAAFEKRSELPPSAKARREARSAQFKANKAAEAAAEAEAKEGAEGDDAAEEADAPEAPEAAAPVKPEKALRRITKEYIPIDSALGAEEWQQIASFYGLESSLTSRFVMRAEGDRSIFLISEGTAQLLRCEVKLPTRMVMCGVLALQRTGSYHERAIPWRLAQEGLAQLALVGLRRKLLCSRSLLRRLLAERELTLAEVREAAAKGDVTGLEAITDPEAADGGLLPGCIALVLQEEGKLTCPFAIAATLSEGALELQASAAELASLAEDLNGQPSIDEILSTSVSAGASGGQDVEADAEADAAEGGADAEQE